MAPCALTAFFVRKGSILIPNSDFYANFFC